MPASITPYNFTDTDVVDFYVDGIWGGSNDAKSGGGKSVCCVLIPEKWRPGLAVNIKWKKTMDEKIYSTKVSIPAYSESAGLQVIFMKNNKVEVYVMDYWPCSAKHPMLKNICGNGGEK